MHREVRFGDHDHPADALGGELVKVRIDDGGAAVFGGSGHDRFDHAAIGDALARAVVEVDGQALTKCQSRGERVSSSFEVSEHLPIDLQNQLVVGLLQHRVGFGRQVSMLPLLTPKLPEVPDRRGLDSVREMVDALDERRSFRERRATPRVVLMLNLELEGADTASLRSVHRTHDLSTFGLAIRTGATPAAGAK
jgi:hypothetical protein